jgi:NAD(P)-dependent dehydrogenase (short-subunit alcohol dehydrogenase family)
MMQMRDLIGTVVVTGGSRGIGAASARLAAARGYAVCVNYRQDQAAAIRVLDEILATGGRACAVRADVGEEPDVVRLFDEAMALGAPLVGLVNNAGVLETQMRVVDMDAARLERILRVNVIGAFLCAREAVQRMSTTHGGARPASWRPWHPGTPHPGTMAPLAPPLARRTRVTISPEVPRCG